MISAATLADLLSLLQAGETLLLPTARSAADLRHTFALHNPEPAQPPAALTLQQLTSGLWSTLIVSGAEPRLLLNPAQEHSLWREIVASTQTLTSIDALATLAASAFSRAAAYNALQRLRASATTHDTRTFAAWADSFTRLCDTRSCLPAALLDHALLQHLEAGSLPLPSALHLVDLTDPTPSQTNLLESLRARGTDLHHRTLTAPSDAPHEAHHLLTPTPHDELFTAARFARTFLQANPGARVALILPTLSEDAPQLESILRQTLAPELQSIAADLSSTPWEIPQTTPLTNLPLIATALDIARLATGPLPFERISALLLSPYLGDTNPATTEAIAHFDTRVLRQLPNLRPELDLPALVALLDRTRNQQSPHPTAAALPSWPRNLLTTLQRSDLKRPRSFADWTDLLHDLLRSADFPGSRPPTVLEHSASRALDSAFDLIATLDFTGRPTSLSTTLDALTRQLETSTLTPPPTHAPVQVLTPADSAACLFDAAVFLRCTDANWPAFERPHPLLPWSLQRSINMPGADTSAASARALALTSGLLARTPAVLFTSAAEDANGHLRPSPILAELAIPSAAEPHFDPHSATSTILETHPDTDLPPLPSPNVHGGANVLQLQAACGFRAFTELRLRASAPDTSTLGLDAGDSGSRLHLALQLFWSRVKTQQELRDLSPAERDRSLRESIDEAFLHRLRPQGPWDEAYLSVQKQRLAQLLHQWLERELQRGPFTVLGREVDTEVTVGPLQLNVRIDRIDRIDKSADGFVYIDYKTGLAPKPSAWDEPRPDEPQLPLYAAFLTQPGELRGLAFAKVRAGKEMKWLGYQSEDGILPASRSNPVLDLEARLEDWRQTLTVLAYDFAEGRAFVHPKLYPNTCKHCTQRLLCRLDPATLLTLANEEDDDPEAADV